MATRGNREHIATMVKVWKIIAHPPPPHGKATEKEYYLVAVPEQRSAERALRLRKDHLSDARLELCGEAAPDFVAWVGGMKDGEILCVMAVS
jgi:hypothetical protein